MALSTWRVGSVGEDVYLDLEVDETDQIVLSVTYKNATSQKAQLRIRRDDGTSFSVRLSSGVVEPFTVTFPRLARPSYENTQIDLDWPAPLADLRA